MSASDSDNTQSAKIRIGVSIGQYRVISLIGAGGMGQVHLARDERLDRLVALKTLSPSLASSEQNRKRFLNEARASARLNHKNICQVHSIEEYGDLVLISMEFVQGSVLKDIIDQKPMEAEQVRDIAIQCCEGFRAAHDEQVIHRDVKSSNIMLDKYGTVKVLDFGLAKFLNDASATQSAAIIGTYKYMSPEQITGKNLDARSDIFSLGVVLFEAITGQLPFHGDNVAAIAYSLVHGEYPQIRDLRADAPANLVSVINRAMARNVGLRYQSMDEMLTDLRAGAGSVVAVAPSVGLASASLAVFPFRNLSRAEDDLYLADGICEEVITSLAKIPQIIVASRSAVARFSGQEYDPINVATQLRVGHFVEGSLRRMGDKLRLNAQLTRISDGMLVWSESYDRNIDDLFSLQTDIAQQVAAALNVRLAPERSKSGIAEIAINPQAYDLYLQAKFCLKRRDAMSVNRGILLLEQAVEIDPKFASAYGELAMAVGLAIGYDFDYPVKYEGKLEELALQAIDLNPGSSQAHMSLFFHNRFRDMNKGIAALRTAIALDSSNFEAYHLLAHAYMFSGLYNSALRSEKAGIQLDPFQEMADAHLVRIYFFAGEETKVKEQLDQLAGKFSDSFIYHSTRGWLSWVKRDWEAALESYLKALKKDAANRWTIDHLCDSYLRLNEIGKADELIEAQWKRQPNNVILLARRGQIARRRGDHAAARKYADLAIELDEKAAQKRDSVESAIYYFDRAWVNALCGFKEEAISNVLLAIQNGYRHYGELRSRPDWDILRECLSV